MQAIRSSPEQVSEGQTWKDSRPPQCHRYNLNGDELTIWTQMAMAQIYVYKYPLTTQEGFFHRLALMTLANNDAYLGRWLKVQMHDRRQTCTQSRQLLPSVAPGHAAKHPSLRVAYSSSKPDTSQIWHSALQIHHLFFGKLQIAAACCSYNVDMYGPCASCSNSRHLSWAHLKGCESGDIWGDSCGYLRWSNFGNRWCCDRKFKHTASYSWTGLKVWDGRQ